VEQAPSLEAPLDRGTHGVVHEQVFDSVEKHGSTREPHSSCVVPADSAASIASYLILTIVEFIRLTSAPRRPHDRSGRRRLQADVRQAIS
jgi:hypothetical protein